LINFSSTIDGKTTCIQINRDKPIEGSVVPCWNGPEALSSRWKFDVCRRFPTNRWAYTI